MNGEPYFLGEVFGGLTQTVFVWFLFEMGVRWYRRATRASTDREGDAS